MFSLFQIKCRRIFTAVIICLAIGFLFSIGNAWAQIVIPKPAEPGRIEKRFEEPKLPKSRPKPFIPRAPETLPPSDMEKIKFVLSGILIEGATIYRSSDFFPLYKDFLGKEISLVEVFQIAKAITAKYRDDGYVLSRAIVPQQTIQGGVVLIRVVEGFIDDVVIDGLIKNPKLLKIYGRKIIRSRPLHIKVLERYLLLIDDLPGIKVKSVITPSKDIQGAATLTLVTTQKPLDGTVSMENRGTKFSGSYLASAGVALNSMLGFYELIGFRFITGTQPEELVLGSANYSQPIGTEGTEWFVSGMISRTEPGFTLDEFDVQGKLSAISFMISHPFIRSREENLSVNFGFTRRDTETFILGALASRDRLRVLNLGASYDFVDEYAGLNLISFEIRQGLNIFNHTGTGSENLTREKGHSDFTKFNGSLLRLQQIAPNWTLLAQVSGQYSFSTLLSSEEFVAGGLVVRAYDSSEITGSNGMTAKAEIQYAQKSKWPYLKGYQAYAFFDHGTVWQKEAEAGTPKQESLQALGTGVRFNLTDKISGYIEITKPLSRRVGALGNKSFRTFFKMAVRF